MTPFWRPWETSLLKTLWEKEKLLATSTFSFSHSVFYPFGYLSAIFVEFEIVVCKLFQFGRVQNLSFGKGLILDQTIPTWLFTTKSQPLTTLGKKPFENIVGKGENAGNQHFLIFPQCFLPFQIWISIFKSHYFVACKFFQFGLV